MAFSFLKRSYAHVQAWWWAKPHRTDQCTNHQCQSRLINRFGQVDLTTWFYTLPSQQPIPKTTLTTLKKPQPVHVRMDTTPKSVLVCASCGSITDPRSRHTPCTAHGCGSELKLADVCTCLHLPINDSGTKTHRIYRQNCHVHDE